jgi:hypothetical protein
MTSMGRDKLMKVVLTDNEIAEAEMEAEKLVDALPWPVLWAIAAKLGYVDPLGASEYRSATERALEYNAPKKTA